MCPAFPSFFPSVIVQSSSIVLWRAPGAISLCLSLAPPGSSYSSPPLLMFRPGQAASVRLSRHQSLSRALGEQVSSRHHAIRSGLPQVPARWSGCARAPPHRQPHSRVSGEQVSPSCHAPHSGPFGSGSSFRQRSSSIRIGLACRRVSERPRLCQGQAMLLWLRRSCSRSCGSQAVESRVAERDFFPWGSRLSPHRSLAGSVQAAKFSFV